MDQTPDQSLLAMLQQQLQASRALDESVRAQNRAGTIIQVPSTGKMLSSAYEQLRNAAEYTEEHLLLQHAIRRFYNRTLFLAGSRPKNVGQELIVELTHAGYLPKDTLSQETAATVSQLASSYEQVYGRLRKSRISREKALDWVLSVLSVETENRLNPHSRYGVLAYAAYQHYTSVLVRPAKSDQHYELSLFIAIHQALLKSDIAVVRTELLRTYRQSADDLRGYIEFNRTIDSLFVADQTIRLKRTIIKRGAPFRILNSMAQDRPDLVELLGNQNAFMEAYRQQIQQEYVQVRQRISRGIIKSIIFIFITKVVIGLGVEVPFDILVYGHVILLPLIINLTVPPLYMASLRFGLHMPPRGNAHDLSHYIETVLYGDGQVIQPLRYIGSPPSAVARVAYTILFLVPFGLTVFALNWLQFNVLQMAIFFVFLSTASFLGFRLNSMVRELELHGHQTGLLDSLRGFFYLPFILFGQWLSGKYARINAIGYLLDIAIELPLKTVLRLVRQWIRFLNDKREEMY